MVWTLMSMIWWLFPITHFLERFNCHINVEYCVSIMSKKNSYILLRLLCTVRSPLPRANNNHSYSAMETSAAELSSRRVKVRDRESVRETDIARKLQVPRANLQCVPKRNRSSTGSISLMTPRVLTTFEICHRRHLDPDDQRPGYDDAHVPTVDETGS